MSTARQELVERAARLAGERGLLVATAESLTSGAIASSLGAGPQAASWFAGGVVAYTETVKFDLLGVERGPVVTAGCAEQMAAGVRTLLKADVAMSATGVGGPEPSEGEPPGTVFVTVDDRGAVTTLQLQLDGGPEQVLDRTLDHALELLVQVLAVPSAQARENGG